MKGRVIKSTGSWYILRTEEGHIYNSRIKGKFRLDKSKLTNPVAVGDMVEFELEEKETDQGIITKIEERKNYLIRRSNKLSSQFQIIASNIDQILLLATVAHPRTTTVFIDRILLAAEAYQIPVILIFNKRDIYTPSEIDLLNDFKAIYQSIGYPVMVVSAFDKNDLDAIKLPICNKISLITGHSGVGKSTIMNQLNPTLGLKTGNLSKYHERGTHNTTFAEMHEIDEGSYVIDTPGIKDFGVVEFDQDNVSMYFPDIRKYAGLCKFNNCKHIDEPGCKVLQAIKENQIHLSRYESYLNIISSLQKP
ncbi:MAG: ribosome small subunit-dependent GTPase A [Bacteroidia bacterium]